MDRAQFDDDRQSSCVVAWNGNLPLLAVGGSPDDFTTATVLTSPDGVTWTPRDPVSARCLFALVWNGNQWLAVGNSGAELTSLDGLTWKLGNTGSGVAQRGVSWNGTTFIAVGQFGTILTSADGETWADRSSAAVTGANDLFGMAARRRRSQTVAVGGKGTLLGSTAMNASSWTLRSSGDRQRLAFGHRLRRPPVCRGGFLNRVLG